MSFNQIKFYAEKYLAVLTGVGTVAVMSLAISTVNQCRNGGFSLFTNKESNTFYNNLNGKCQEKYKEKSEEISDSYSLVDETKIFNDENFVSDGLKVGGGELVIITGEQKVSSDFIGKLKNHDIYKGNEAISNLNEQDTEYKDLIGGDKAFKDKESFVIAVNSVIKDERNKKLEELKVEIDWDEIFEENYDLINGIKFKSQQQI